ncbi:MAG: tRNA pseudouridine(38-40) synthase TruA [Defluviitaleaceae bacterium]|nr:tRNA pseudouridine(38-40) synthase TruA [Defluviitaleaceae bacterium]
MRILLTLAYDGTNYCGWQRQINGPSVQQTLEEALAVLLNRNINDVKTIAASRTDAGVHALGQRAVFDIDELKIPLDKFPKVLNGLLPSDISATSAQFVPKSFNPRFAAKYKTYAYHIHHAPIPNPLLRRYSAFVPQPLDIEAMQKAARHFIGRHDFTSFCAAGGSAKTTVREVYQCEVMFLRPSVGNIFHGGSAEVIPGERHFPCGPIEIIITGNGFLYNMVRIIAGTLVYVGLGKIPHEAIPEIIAAKDRTKAGKTMPPEGLVLEEVGYQPFTA